MAEATCEELLAEAKNALHQLLTGKKIASVGYGDRKVNYTTASIAELRQYIAGLEAECGSATAQANQRRPFRVQW